MKAEEMAMMSMVKEQQKAGLTIDLDEYLTSYCSSDKL